MKKLIFILIITLNLKAKAMELNNIYLPEEIIVIIAERLLENNFSKLKNSKDIFEFYDNFDKNKLKELTLNFQLTCKYLNYIIKNYFNLKIKDKLKSLKELSIKDYKNLKKSDLNEKLFSKLNKWNIPNFLIKDLDQEILLENALNLKDLKECINLILAGANINMQDDKYESTILMKAIKKKKIGLIKLILDLNANKYIKNINNKSALDIAIETKDPNIIKLLNIESQKNSEREKSCIIA